MSTLRIVLTEPADDAKTIRRQVSIALLARKMRSGFEVLLNDETALAMARLAYKHFDDEEK